MVELKSVLDDVAKMCGAELGDGNFCERKKGHKKDWHGYTDRSHRFKATIQFPMKKGDTKK